MSIRFAQAQSMSPRPGGAARGPSAPPARGSEKPAPGGRAPLAAEPLAKGALAKGPDSREGAGRGRFELLQGEARPTVPLPAERPVPLTVAPELSRERVAGREDSSAQRQALEDRAKLRAEVRERLLQGMLDVHGRLSRFLEKPGRLGVVNLSLVLSASTVTRELWKGASGGASARQSLARSLGVGPEASDAALLRSLMAEVHEASVEFQASPSGREARQRYEEVLQRYEEVRVLPVVPGHDTGPLGAELARLGLTPPPDFTRSLLVSPRLLAVGLAPDEGTASQVMVMGLGVSPLGGLVAQLRRLNPRLSNPQVLQLLRLASTDLKSQQRKALGQAEVEQVQGYARQLLRLQAVERLHC